MPHTLSELLIMMSGALIVGFLLGDKKGFKLGHRVGWTDGVGNVIAEMLKGKTLDANVIHYVKKKD